MGVRVRHRKSVFKTIIPEGAVGTIYKAIGKGPLKCFVVNWDDLPDRKIALREGELEFLRHSDYGMSHQQKEQTDA